jgi:hypothetical protein
VFPGGATTGAGAPGSGVAYFEFTASNQGSYVIASTMHARALAGEWVHLDVVPADQPPELALPEQQFAIVARGGPGG